MTIESDDDLVGPRKIGRIVRMTLREMKRHVRPGVTTRELDEVGANVMTKFGARSAPRLAYDFPGHTCISVNDEAAHGVPGDRVLRAGDLVNIDASAELGGYWADTGASIPVGPASAAVARLCACTRLALRRGISAARTGRPLNAIGRAVETVARRGGYNVVKNLAGHGVGRFIHEPPTVSNVYFREDRQRLTDGLVIAIEPFLTDGADTVIEAGDGWTLKTIDGALPAQFEHTVVVTRGHPIVIT